jgi:hypothetical protein
LEAHPELEDVLEFLPTFSADQSGFRTWLNEPSDPPFHAPSCVAAWRALLIEPPASLVRQSAHLHQLH